MRLWPVRPSLLRLQPLLLILAAAAPAPAAAQQGGAQEQPPTVVEAICLEGGREAKICACAEQRLFDRLGAQAYAQYEAVSQAYLTNPSNGWPAAAADVAAIAGGVSSSILEETKTHGRAHRDEIRRCAR